MKLRLKVSEIAPILITLYATWYFIISGIFMKAWIQIFCASLIMLSCVVFLKKRRLTVADLLWLLSLIPFLYVMREWSPTNIRDMIVYLCFIMFIIMVKGNTSIFDKALSIIVITASFQFVCIIIQVLMRTQFDKFLYSILSSGAVATFERAISGNYYTGFGYIPGDTSGYFVDAILVILFCKNIVKKKHQNLLLVLFMIGVFMCSKKSHLLCLIIVVALCCILSATKNKKIQKIVSITLMIFCFLIVGYVLLPFFSKIPMVNRISQSIELLLSGTDFTSNRTNLTALAMEFFVGNKIFGIGWKEFNQYTFLKWGNTNYVNNVYVQLLTETGIFGTILFVTPMIYTLLRTLSWLKRSAYNPEDRGYLLFSLGIQLFYLIYGLFEIPFYDYTFLFIYGLAVAIANSCCLNQARRQSVNSEIKDGRIRNEANL